MKKLDEQIQKFLDTMSPRMQIQRIPEIIQSLYQRREEAKEEAKIEFQKRLERVIRHPKFPNSYGVVLYTTKGIGKERSYRVRNKHTQDWEVLEAMEEIVREAELHHERV